MDEIRIALRKIAKSAKLNIYASNSLLFVNP